MEADNVTVGASRRKPKPQIEVAWERDPSETRLFIGVTHRSVTEEQIKVQHPDLITGMTQLYDTLKDIQYIEDSETHRPSHQNFPADKLAAWVSSRGN